MHWLIQENIGHEDKFQSLIDSIIKLDQTYDLVKVIPFIGEITPDINPIDKNVICFGAYSMRKLAAKKGWTPGVYDIEWFPYTALIDALGTDVLNHDAVFGTFGDIVPEQDEFFMRPIHDGKEFAGVIKSAGQLKEWQTRVIALGLADNGSTLTSETPIMCSQLRKIYNEYRYFVVDGKAVTGSQYKLGKRVVYGDTDGHLDIAQEFVDRLNGTVDQPYVIDIALTDDGHKVIEMNTLNCAGFYAADMQKLTYALVEYESNKE